MNYGEVTLKSYPSDVLPNIAWEQRKCFVSKDGLALVDVIHQMEVRDDDVWVVTLPKCGTTWMQELVWLAVNDYAFDEAKSVYQELRSPFVDFDFMVSKDLTTCLDRVNNLKSPRVLKTHLPLPLLPIQLWQKKPKVIYVYRNPKDYLVSMYHHSKSFGQNLETSLEDYVLQRIEQNPVENLSFDHVTEFYALRKELWVYYTSYERMSKNLGEVIGDVCRFLGKAISEKQMEMMLQHLSFEGMKNNPMTHHLWEYEQFGIQKHKDFLRKGQVGSHKEELSAECIGRLEAWMAIKLAKHNVSLEQLLLLQDAPDDKV